MFFLMQLYRLDQIMVEFVPKSAESAFFGHFQPKINQNRPKMRIFHKNRDISETRFLELV